MQDRGVGPRNDTRTARAGGLGRPAGNGGRGIGHEHMFACGSDRFRCPAFADLRFGYVARVFGEYAERTMRRMRASDEGVGTVRGFGDLEAVIMDRIWDRDTETTSVRDIYEELCASRDIAYTTVMSTMDNLHRKGWLARERAGKAYRYWPTLTREEHSARLMLEALGSGGRSDLVLSHFVDRISDEESAGLRAALRRLTARKSPGPA